MIKSDRWIRRQCEQPMGEVHVWYKDAGGVDTNIVEPVFSKENYNMFDVGPVKDRVLQKLVERGVIPSSHHADSCEFQRFFHSDKFKPMIEPFSPDQVKTRHADMMARIASGELPVGSDFDGDPEWNKERMISWGTSSYGYDIRCGNEFKVFTNINSTVVDPKNFDDESFVDVEATPEKPYIIIPPNSFALARTVEYFRIPRNVLTVCVGKSTYARCGIIVNVTPFEPEWEGYVTLEFSNTTPLPAKIYAGEGCAQVLFFESDEDCETSYKDRNGKYMGQIGLPVTPKV